jgi:hypothetical protein
LKLKINNKKIIINTERYITGRPGCVAMTALSNLRVSKMG